MKFVNSVAVTFVVLAIAANVESFSNEPSRVVQAKSSWQKTIPASHVKRSSTKLYDAPGGAVAIPADSAPSGGTATISNEIFNLVKGIVGAGVLSLPAGT